MDASKYQKFSVRYYKSLNFYSNFPYCCIYREYDHEPFRDFHFRYKIHLNNGLFPNGYNFYSIQAVLAVHSFSIHANYCKFISFSSNSRYVGYTHKFTHLNPFPRSAGCSFSVLFCTLLSPLFIFASQPSVTAHISI